MKEVEGIAMKIGAGVRDQEELGGGSVGKSQWATNKTDDEQVSLALFVIIIIIIFILLRLWRLMGAIARAQFPSPDDDIKMRG